jgi:hypothetical protein
MRAFIGSAMVALTITTAEAQEDITSANFWLPLCKEFVEQSWGNEIRFGLAMYCAGVVQGIVDMTQNSDVGAGQAWRCVNIPHDVANQQRVGVIVHYIEARPWRMRELFSSLVLESLRDAWPCRP